MPRPDILIAAGWLSCEQGVTGGKTLLSL